MREYLQGGRRQEECGRAGRHQVAFDTMPAATPYVRSGRMRALAVTSVKRVAELADLPTVAEEEFAAMVRADIARYAKLVKEAGLQID